MSARILSALLIKTDENPWFSPPRRNEVRISSEVYHADNLSTDARLHQTDLKPPNLPNIRFATDN